MAFSEFPKINLVPKVETGVINFLQKYPEFDGRDTIIAIFDSGVDPKVHGLKNTSDGSVKVIERFDCSGCGDTDMSKKVTANADGTITGLSGRILKLSDHIKSSNKDGQQYRVGLKSLHDLYPSKIREKVSADLKLKKWDEAHKTAIADTARELTKFEAQHSDAQALNLKDKLKKEDLENSLEFLNNFEKKFMDIRTTYDCILFRTENGWIAVVDITETGDLENAIIIGEYTKTHETKNVDDLLSISINVHDEGNVLEIVGMCSSHGTHVASIASGNHSDKELDGVAPNAKIVSLTIGDGRLGSMETGTGLVRAMIKIMELCKSGTKIDVINMSYGEHGHWSNSGRIGELMNEVVNKYGVVWVASAGNHGPALCTIGTPPDIFQSTIIGVGAYVSPSMMEAEYSLREKLPGNVYTWTSRDPCVDGGRGVTVCAPGAAITSVPEFTMCRSQLMNGTSMAAPHVAGAVALLISGLKQKNIKYSPYSIKRALSETATRINYIDEFAQGNGLLNVEKAFEHLVKYSNEIENMIRFSVKVGAQSKGIHIRSAAIKKPSEYNVSIEPVFFNEKEVAPKDKIDFNVRLNLISTEAWVKCGSFLDLCYSLRTISIKIDPSGLQPGVHTASVNAYDTSSIEKGVLFQIPITVVQPHIIDLEKSRLFLSNGALEFKPNTIQRDFILVPNKATWAVLKMCSIDDKENQFGKFFVHTMQLLPMRYCKSLETMKILPVNTETETIHAFKVEPNNILELCIAKYWSNFGDTKLKYSLEFHGIATVNSNPEAMFAAHGIHRIDVSAMDSVTEEISPNVQFKNAAIILKSTEQKISPLSPERDVIPDGRQIYQNILTYNLHVNKSTEIALYTPILYTNLYESEYESQLWMLFDSNKMMLHCGDAYSDSNFIKLEKGEYTVKLQVRHEKKDYLEKLNEINMLAIFKIQNLSIDFYYHYNQALIGGKKITSVPLFNGQTRALYVAPIANEKLTKASVPAQAAWLNGVLTLAKDDLGKKCDLRYFRYVLIESGGTNSKNSNSSNSSSSNNSSGNNNNSPKKSKADDYKDGLRDYQTSQIAKVELELAEEIYNGILVNHPKHLPAHLMLIQNLESTETKIQYPFAFNKLLMKKTIQTVETSTVHISGLGGSADLKSTGTRSGSGSGSAESISKTTGAESNLVIVTKGGTGAGSSSVGIEDKLDIIKLTESLNRIIQLANLIIAEADINSLLVYYGMKNDSRTDAAKIKTKMDKLKLTLLEALCKKGISLCKLMLIETYKNNKSSEEDQQKQIDEIDSIYVEISKFIDCNDSKVVNFSIWHAHANAHYGRLVKYLQKNYDEKLNRDVLDELSSVSDAKNWTHITQAIKKIAISANPMGYRLF